MAAPAVSGPASAVITATVARRYYLDGKSKIEIADELGMSRFKVARLLEWARTSGMVRIELSYPGELDVELSSRLQEAYGLRHCVVVRSDEQDPATLRENLGRAAASLLVEIVGTDDVLGLAWARSLMGMRSSLTGLATCPVVQLTGALSRPDVDESSIELVRDIARINNGAAFYFYAPMILPDSETARVLRSQPEVARAIDRFASVTKAVVGVGAWSPTLSTVVDALPAVQQREMRSAGVCAELCGIQIDAHGGAVRTGLTDRTIGISAEQLRAVPEVIGIVYGTVKAPAVRAALEGGFVHSLVTHASMAETLLAMT